MKNSVFIIFSILLFSIYLETYSFLKFKFSGIEQMRAQVTVLKENLRREQFKEQLAHFELQDYQQHIATLLPDEIKGKESDPSSYQLRSLASIATGGGSMMPEIERASSLFERGQKEFRENTFADSNKVFSTLIERYPNSVHAPDAYFLLAEGQFQAKDYDHCLSTIDTMISLYPEHDLTGFALIRLGKIYEQQDRIEDAVEVYRAVLKSYGNSNLQKQAKASLKAVEL